MLSLKFSPHGHPPSKQGFTWELLLFHVTIISFTKNNDNKQGFALQRKSTKAQIEMDVEVVFRM